MRVLWVKADKLVPVENGGNIRSYHLLRFLASRHELTFYSYYGGKTDPDYERELQRQLPGSVAVCTGKKELSGVARGLDYVAHLGTQAPYALAVSPMPVCDNNSRRGSENNGLTWRFAISWMQQSIFPNRSGFPASCSSITWKARYGDAMRRPRAIEPRG
jgi:hypothetical protein